jgi:cell division protein FtsQ
MKAQAVRHDRAEWVGAMDAASAALVVLAFLIACYALGFWVLHRPYFRLATVRVEAQGGVPFRHVDVATIRAGALPGISGNFFTANLSQVRDAFESVAWVRHARVRRHWPNQLDVALEEQQVAALWNDDALVNPYGEAFTANIAEAQAEGALPQLNGPAGTQREVLQHYVDFTHDFAKLGLRPIEVTLSPRYSWSTRLDNGTTEGLIVELGRDSETGAVNERIDRMLATYPVVTTKWPHVTLIDLRYPNGFALRAENLRLAADAKPGTKTARTDHNPPASAPRKPALKT